MIPPGELRLAIEQRFVCGRCGECCKGEGVVEFGEDEADRMAAHLGLSRRKFLRAYARPLRRGRWRLIDRENEELWCIFLARDEQGLFGCSIHAAKPDQCRTFPAEWRNPDSFRTCAGLRDLMTTLRAERAAAPSSPAAPAPDEKPS